MCSTCVDGKGTGGTKEVLRSEAPGHTVCSWGFSVVASMKRLGFFPRPVSLQQSMLGINDRLVRLDAAVGPN